MKSATKQAAVKVKPSVVQTVTTRQIYDSFVSKLSELIWDGTTYTNWGSFTEILNGLASADVEAIREAFTASGYAVSLAPEAIDVFNKADKEADIELRIYDEDNKLVTVLVNKEISW